MHSWYEEEYYQYNEFYPSMHNNSTLISLYSFFEVNLKGLCITFERHLALTIKLNDLAGNNYIDKGRKYLKLVCELNLDDLNREWQKITEYQKVRNCIVHNESSIIKTKGQSLQSQTLYSIISTNPHLKLNESNGKFIISDVQYLIDFCEIIERYLVSLIKKAETLIKNKSGI